MDSSISSSLPFKELALFASLATFAVYRIYTVQKRDAAEKAEAKRLHDQFFAQYSTATDNVKDSRAGKNQTQTPRSDSFVLFEKERRKVVVQIPATSANLGCGFDCLGMALDMWNELIVERATEFRITAEGEGADDIPLDETNYVVRGLESAFKFANKPVPPLHYHLKQRIPHGRGLGSSSAAIVGGLIAGLALTGQQIQVQGKEMLLQLATEIEGHPDNVAPAMYGGVQLGIFNESEQRWETERLQLPHGLKFVMFITNFTGKTEELRKVVPKTIPLADAIFNMGRVGWLVNALSRGKLECLKEAFKDRLHQPYRAKVYRHLDPLIEAAYANGALAAYLSGAGPVVMAITAGGSGDYFTQKNRKEDDMRVAEGMMKAAESINVKGRMYITHASNTGAVVTFADPPYSNELVTFNGET